MGRPASYNTSLFILASAALGAAAIVLIPALFEGFNIGRLVIILVLMASAIAFGIAAKRSRRKGIN